MQIDVYSRQQILELDPNPEVAVISISGPADRAPLKEGWGPLLRVEFHDVVIPRDEMPVMVELDGGPVVLFDEVMAEQIDVFAWANKDKNFAVHCAAGVSRSVAVGMFLKTIFEGNLNLHAIHTTAAANALVHRTLMRKYWAEQFS